MNRVMEGFKAFQWYVHEVMGDNAYAKYVAHLKATHPDAEIPTEKQFWIDKHLEAERNPKSRCC